MIEFVYDAFRIVGVCIGYIIDLFGYAGGFASVAAYLLVCSVLVSFAIGIVKNGFEFLGNIWGRLF